MIITNLTKLIFTVSQMFNVISEFNYLHKVAYVVFPTHQIL